MASFLLLLICSFASGSTIPKFAGSLSGKDLIDYLNFKQDFFKAEESIFSKDEMRARVMKGEFTEMMEGAPVAEEIVMKIGDIPDSFDSRQKWPHCASIRAIYDQGQCGSCWAFCTAELISDRTCIAKNQQVVLSPQDILGCVESGHGCNGGPPLQALNFWDTTGVCTGKCRPYTGGNGNSPTCQKNCQPYYNGTYQQDKHFGASAYYIPKDVAAIQKEILTHGPVSSSFSVYEDFYSYRSGVYVHTGGKYVGGHCVKTIGWGVDKGTPYWLVANSWNTNWGEKGFFRIRRGTNEVGFESSMAAGLAK